MASPAEVLDSDADDELAKDIQSLRAVLNENAGPVGQGEARRPTECVGIFMSGN